MNLRRFTLAFVTAPVLLILSSPSFAIPAEWSATETRCAKSLGIDVGVRSDPTSPTYERHLAWIADLIVYAQVTEIRHDIRGDFHSVVTLKVLSTKKGTPPDGAILVDLVSGPSYIVSRSVIGTATLFGEPSFSEGETVLLFLSTGTWEIPGNPTAFTLAPGHYRLTDNVKWIVDGELVKEVGGAPHEHPLKWVDGEIDFTVKAQKTDCDGIIGTDGP